MKCAYRTRRECEWKRDGSTSDERRPMDDLMVFNRRGAQPSRVAYEWAEHGRDTYTPHRERCFERSFAMCENAVRSVVGAHRFWIHLTFERSTDGLLENNNNNKIYFNTAPFRRRSSPFRSCSLSHRFVGLSLLKRFLSSLFPSFNSIPVHPLTTVLPTNVMLNIMTIKINSVTRYELS